MLSEPKRKQPVRGHLRPIKFWIIKQHCYWIWTKYKSSQPQPIKTHPTFRYRPESLGEGFNQHPNKALASPSAGCSLNRSVFVSPLCPLRRHFRHEELLAEYEVRVKAVYQRYNPDAPSETRIWMTDHEMEEETQFVSYQFIVTGLRWMVLVCIYWTCKYFVSGIFIIRYVSII